MKTDVQRHNGQVLRVTLEFSNAELFAMRDADTKIARYLARAGARSDVGIIASDADARTTHVTWALGVVPA